METFFCSKCYRTISKHLLVSREIDIHGRITDICADCLISELSPRLEEIAKQLEPISTIEIPVGDIAKQLKRIADALELLASAVQPQFKDRDATLNVQAVCYTQEI